MRAFLLVYPFFCNCTFAALKILPNFNTKGRERRGAARGGAGRCPQPQPRTGSPGTAPCERGPAAGSRGLSWRQTGRVEGDRNAKHRCGTQAALRAPPAPHRVPAARRGGPRRDAPEGPTCAVGDGCEDANKRSEGARPDRIRSRSQSADGSEGRVPP